MEDLFEPALFTSIVNPTCDLKGKERLAAKSLDEADASTVRFVKKAETAFKVMPDRCSTTYPTA